MRHQRTRRHELVLARAFTVVFLTACGGSTGDDVAGRGEACGLTARIDGRTYVGTGEMRVIPVYGDSLGTAVVPACGGDEAFSIEAFAIVGVDSDVAFASPEYEGSIFVAEGVTTLPDALERLRQEPKCIGTDAPIDLHGPWLGIIGAGRETEVDLAPPYDLEMRVDDASSRRYERSFLTIHVAKDLGRPLSRRDVRSSLWEGGTLSVTTACVDGQFWAEHVTATPP